MRGTARVQKSKFIKRNNRKIGGRHETKFKIKPTKRLKKVLRKKGRKAFRVKVVFVVDSGQKLRFSKKVQAHW